MNVWKETGMLLIKNFLPNDVIDGLHEYAMTKIADGADPGDHFRTTAIKTGYEGRGWAQRAALRRKRPDLLGKFSNRLYSESYTEFLMEAFDSRASWYMNIFKRVYYRSQKDFSNLFLDRFQRQPKFNSMLHTLKTLDIYTLTDQLGFFQNQKQNILTQIYWLLLKRKWSTVHWKTSKVKCTEIDWIKVVIQTIFEMSFQTAFYTGETPRSKGSTGFIPGSNKLLEKGINTINFYNDENINSLLAENCYHGDIPKGVAVVFMSSVLHRTGSNKSGTTRSVSYRLLSGFNLFSFKNSIFGPKSAFEFIPNGRRSWRKENWRVGIFVRFCI